MKYNYLTDIPIFYYISVIMVFFLLTVILLSMFEIYDGMIRTSCSLVAITFGYLVAMLTYKNSVEEMK